MSNLKGKKFQKLKARRLAEIKTVAPEVFEEKNTGERSRSVNTRNVTTNNNRPSQHEIVEKHNMEVIECLKKGDKRYSVRDIQPIE